MFFEKELDNALRLGDVVQGYILANSSFKEPFFSTQSEGYDYKINVELPNYSVVLTPCCSIDVGKLSLTPLIKVRSSFLKNPYFAGDLTRINRKMNPEQTMTSEEWGELTPEDLWEREAEGFNYTLLYSFIYEENEIFKKYLLRQHEIGYYMIDFRNIYTIKCPMIKRSEGATLQDPSIINSKVLQLSIQARDELRNKISYYYTRPPKEDMIAED